MVRRSLTLRRRKTSISFASMDLRPPSVPPFDLSVRDRLAGLLFADFISCKDKTKQHVKWSFNEENLEE